MPFKPLLSSIAKTTSARAILLRRAGSWKTRTAGTATLLDGDGSAFIIHANRDDQVTDAGNGGSGARIACAVIVPDEPRPGG